MGALSRVFGDTPRVRMLEALLELWTLEFTRPEAGEQADLVPDSTYRAVDELESEGYIEQVSEARPATYRVNEANPYLQVVSMARDAIESLERREHLPQFGDAPTEEMMARFGEGLDRTVREAGPVVVHRTPEHPVSSDEQGETDTRVVSSAPG
jgi:DNA-binding IclR family transcriptional regulator